MSTTPIDLRLFREPLHSFLRRSLDDFIRQYPELTVSTVALYVFPYQRVAGLCFDTPSNSQRHVEEWQLRDPYSYCEDNFGRFNHIPEDFAIPEFTDFRFSGMPSFYDVDDPLEFIDVNGNLRNSNRKTEGDEGVNRAMFPTLKALMREFVEWSVLPRGTPFRIGVVIHDSACSEFWTWPVAEPDAGPERPIRWESRGTLIGGRPVSFAVRPIKRFANSRSHG